MTLSQSLFLQPSVGHLLDICYQPNYCLQNVIVKLHGWPDCHCWCIPSDMLVQRISPVLQPSLFPVEKALTSLFNSMKNLEQIMNALHYKLIYSSGEEKISLEIFCKRRYMFYENEKAAERSCRLWGGALAFDGLLPLSPTSLPPLD